LILGGGDGTVAKAIAPLVNRYYYYDLSSEIMKIAKERLKDCGNIVYYQSFEELSKSNNKFDVIIVITVFQHILDNDDLKNTLIDLRAKLNEKGKLFILEDTFSNKEEITNYIHFRSINTFENILIQSGFSIEKTIGFYHPFSKSTTEFNRYYHSFPIMLYKAARKISHSKASHIINFDRLVNKYIGNIKNYIFEPNVKDTSRFYLCTKA
jgi:ubiquinone/menaquinone biosynthesis C-methylase UbiE